MQGLQDKLDQITSNTRRLVQPERLAISEQATADLFSSGIEDGILSVGAPAPPFSLQDASTGKIVSSADLLAVGPLVLNFFRGRWCPYCITELETWRDLYPQLRRTGALFAAVSPQNRRHNAFTAEHLLKNAPQQLAFPILSDPEAELAAMFGMPTPSPRGRGATFAPSSSTSPSPIQAKATTTHLSPHGVCPCLPLSSSIRTPPSPSPRRTPTSAFAPNPQMSLPPWPCSRHNIRAARTPALSASLTPLPASLLFSVPPDQAVGG